MSLDLLTSVRSRADSGAYFKGIGTADFYLRQFEQCVGGSCPSQYFKDVSAFRWRKGLEASAKRLVYHHPSMDVDGDFFSGDAIKAAAPKFGDLPPHTIAAFNAVITTTRQDRDGDILETSGADLDDKATLLYQHMPFEACGRLLLPGKHTSKLLTGSFSICGTPLGEDVAMLAEHGALRISHGFTADDYEPIEGEVGFHILKFKILEVSLVSIPSNPDAEITFFSRDKFHHPFVKALAAQKFAARPIISAATIDVASLASALPAGTSVTFTKAADEKSVAAPTACGCKSHKTEQSMPANVKGADSVTAATLRYKGKERDFFNTERTKGVYVEFENSFDDIRQDLNDALLSYLIAGGVADSGDCCYIVDLFLYQAIVQACSRDYLYGYAPYSDDACSYYMLDWEMGADEEPVWSGVPQHVEITPQITALDKRARSMFVKSLESMNVKDGRKLSAANAAKLKSAAANFKAIADDDEADEGVTELASKGYDTVKGLFATGGDAGDDMTAYTADGESGGDSGKSAELDGEKAGRSISKQTEETIGKAIEHGNNIVAHEKATDEHKALARKSVAKLKGVVGDKSTDGAAAPLISDSSKSVNEGQSQPSEEHVATPSDTKATNTTSNSSANANSSHQRKDFSMDRQETAAGVYGGSAGPTVRKTSERFSSKRFEAHHPRTGQPVYHNGSPVTLPSEVEHAKMGVIFLDIARRKGVPEARELTEWERELLLESKNEDDWCGRYANQDYGPTKLATILGRKGSDLISDSTSGGSDLVPYFFDENLYTFPLLYGELYPQVKVVDMGASNQVIRPRLANVSATWGGSEGSGNSIPLQTTDNLVDKLTSNVYNLEFAITVGRDLMSDSPVKIGSYIGELFSRKAQAELDRVIANGSNANKEILGLTNTSGVNAVVSQNNTTGPYVVKDLEHMLSGLPKQYRNKAENVCWVASDASYFRIRSMATGLTGDQRRVLGYDYEGYRLFNRDFKIQNDVPAGDLMLANLSYYTLYRRSGLAIQTSIEGQTLMRNNEMLWVARSRLAGQMDDGAAISLMTTGSIH